MIQNGAEVNLPFDREITTSLYEAVGGSDINMVKCLLEAGASVDGYYPYDHSTPLAKAVYQSKADIVVALLEKGADSSKGRIFGESILEYSAPNARDIYQLLKEKRGESEGPIPVGEILFAAESGHKTFSNFLHRNLDRLFRKQMEKALAKSLKHSKFEATVVLLDSGVDPNGYTLDEIERPLIVAALTSDVKHSQLLINKGASVDIPSLLQLAVLREDFELLNLLLDEGADLESHGPQALVQATEDGNIEIAAFLLDRGTDANAFGNVFTALQAAARSGNVELAEYLTERGADVNAPASSIKGRTALQAAAENGNFDMIVFLLDQGADVNAPPALPYGVTALEASMSGREITEARGEIFKLLLDSGALVNPPTGSDYKATTILHRFIKGDQVDLIRLVLEAGLNVNHMSDIEGGTPLQLASAAGNLELAKLLIEYGADVNDPPGHNYGRTALQAAASYETLQMELVQFLLDHNANVNAPAGITGGITALQGAAIRGHINMVRMLIERGPDVNARPAIKDGRTAVEGAAEHGRLDTVQVLLNALAGGNATGKISFKRAIDFAENNRHFAVAQLLRDHQAREGEQPIFDL